MRGDTDTFRRLLALVDPVAFGDTTPEAFRARLEERERSAGDVQVLAARRASLRQKTAALDSLLVDFPEDPNIDALAVLCREVADPLAPAWGQLAEYVREIYRLSRRMIRHRRNDAVTASYAVAGRRPTFVEVSDPARPLIDEFSGVVSTATGGHRCRNAFRGGCTLCACWSGGISQLPGEDAANGGGKWFRHCG